VLNEDLASSPERIEKPALSNVSAELYAKFSSQRIEGAMGPKVTSPSILKTNRPPLTQAERQNVHN
jgi:hypothetical protein